MVLVLLFESLGKDYDILIDKFSKDLYFRTSDTRCSNQEIFMYYMDRLFDGSGHSLLLMDTSTTHEYKQSLHRVAGVVEDFLHSRRIHSGIIPEHCTPIIQPLDTHINKVFKNYLKKGWMKYMSDNIENLGGNGRVVGTMDRARNVMCELVRSSWKKINSDLIIKSFKDNGFSLSLDGTEEKLCNVHVKDMDK